MPSICCSGSPRRFWLGTLPQSACIGMHRAADQRFVWPLLHDPSGIHYADTAGNAGHDSQIMRNPQQGGLRLLQSFCIS